MWAYLRNTWRRSRFITDRAEAIRYFERRRIESPQYTTDFDKDLQQLRAGWGFSLELWRRGSVLNTWPPGAEPPKRRTLIERITDTIRDLSTKLWHSNMAPQAI